MFLYLNFGTRPMFAAEMICHSFFSSSVSMYVCFFNLFSLRLLMFEFWFGKKTTSSIYTRLERVDLNCRLYDPARLLLKIYMK